MTQDDGKYIMDALTGVHEEVTKAFKAFKWGQSQMRISQERTKANEVFFEMAKSRVYDKVFEAIIKRMEDQKKEGI